MKTIHFLIFKLTILIFIAKVEVLEPLSSALPQLSSVLHICKSAVNGELTSNEFDALLSFDLPDSQVARCTMTCAFKRLALMTSKGMLNIPSMQELVQKYSTMNHEPEAVIRTRQDLVESCMRVNDEIIADDENTCQRIGLIFNCIFLNIDDLDLPKTESTPPPKKPLDPLQGMRLLLPHSELLRRRTQEMMALYEANKTQIRSSLQEPAQLLLPAPKFFTLEDSPKGMKVNHANRQAFLKAEGRSEMKHSASADADTKEEPIDSNDFADTEELINDAIAGKEAEALPIKDSTDLADAVEQKSSGNTEANERRVQKENPIDVVEAEARTGSAFVDADIVKGRMVRDSDDFLD